jgi:hypothetical protein
LMKKFSQLQNSLTRLLVGVGRNLTESAAMHI